MGVRSHHSAPKLNKTQIRVLLDVRPDGRLVRPNNKATSYHAMHGLREMSLSVSEVRDDYQANWITDKGREVRASLIGEHTDESEE